jgi:hypothetical protein
MTAETSLRAERGNPVRGQAQYLDRRVASLLAMTNGGIALPQGLRDDKLKDLQDRLGRDQ